MPNIIVMFMDIKERPSFSTYRHAVIYNNSYPPCFISLFLINLCPPNTHSCYQTPFFLFLIVIQNCNLKLHSDRWRIKGQMTNSNVQEIQEYLRKCSLELQYLAYLYSYLCIYIWYSPLKNSLSSYRKFSGVGFDLTTTEFRSDALTD